MSIMCSPICTDQPTCRALGALCHAAIGSEGRVSVRPTPRSTPTHRQMPSNGEQLLAFKAHEYLDSR